MRQRQSTAERFRAVDELLGDAVQEPLDEGEQEKLISEFQALSLQQQRTWRVTIGGGLLLAGLFFAYAALQQHLEPFGVRYTGELRSTVAGPPGAVSLVLFCQCMALLSAAGGLLRGLPPSAAPGRGALITREGGCAPCSSRQWGALGLGVALSVVGGAYWGAALLRMVALHGRQYGSRWELSWLPAGPLAGCLLACYAAHSLNETERELQQLRSYRYRFKKA